jgi:hypothetical protein
MGNKKDISRSRRFIIHDSRTPGIEKVVIHHDLDEIVLKIYGEEEKKRGKPADIIPLKRDR